MPHECTTCGRTFPDGSKEMLSGCPDCGGNKFQFHPSGIDSSSGTDIPDGDAGVSGEDTGVNGDKSDTAQDPSFEFGSSPGSAPTSDEKVDPPEDSAQVSARSAVVSEDDLPRSGDDSPEEETEPPPTPDDGPDSEASDSDRPDLSELRAELNEQFESIKIHDRGEYELNLMELYDREEHIVALQEDGRYVIDVPGSWRDDEVE